MSRARLTAALLLLAWAAPRSFASEESYRARPGLIGVGAFILFYRAEGPLSFQTMSRRDLPPDAVDYRKGRRSRRYDRATMSNRTLALDESLSNYLRRVGVREPSILRELREETAPIAGAGMQIAPEQGQFMALLVELIQAERCLEIGTFTGYSSLAVALALPPHGRIVCCDVSHEWTSMARRYWRTAGVDDKMDLRLAPALETLEELIAAGDRFDFAFIDADKENYEAYYEACLTLLRPGGLLAIDNVLWNGAVADPAQTDVDTEAIRATNERVHADDRVSLSLIPIGDGLTLARKR